MADVDVTFTVRVNAALIESLGLDHWVNYFALNHDVDVSTWPEVFHLIGMEYLAGGELSTYVIDSGGSQTRSTTPRPGDPDVGVDVKAPDVLEARDGSTAQVWRTDAP